jgi:hypothetical protein
VQYTATSATNVSALTYYHLSLIPAGTVTYTLGTAAAQNIIIGGNFTVGNGTNALTVTAATNSPDILIRGNMTIATNAVYTKSATGVMSFRKGAAQTFTDNTAGSGQDLGIVQVDANTTNTTLNLGSKATMTSLTISASQVFSHNGSNTLILTGTGTPLTVTGTYTPSTGTLDYVGAGATTITATTYNNLGVKPGSNTTTHTAASGTLTVNGNLTVGNGTNTRCWT